MTTWWGLVSCSGIGPIFLVLVSLSLSLCFLPLSSAVISSAHLLMAPNLGGGFHWIRWAQGPGSGNDWAHCFLLWHSVSFSAPVLAWEWAACFGMRFLWPHRLNQGSFSAPFIYHSPPGPNGCLCEQPAIPMATQPPKILLPILFTEWLSWWWLNQWLQPWEVWGAWAVDWGNRKIYQRFVDTHCLPCTDFRGVNISYGII